MTNVPLKKVRCKVCRDEFWLVELKNGVCVDCNRLNQKETKYERRNKKVGNRSH